MGQVVVEVGRWGRS